uniref:glucuronosyltransferase n=1 Tax=Ascaris lumbricoides TaxID=6252 RepID=A0A0M3HJY8_ASCLU
MFSCYLILLVNFVDFLQYAHPGHPKLSAFVTHGGQNSVIESTNAGIPMICVPLFGDQMRNAKMAEKRNVAFLVDKRFISSDSLSDAIRTVLYNQT